MTEQKPNKEVPSSDLQNEGVLNVEDTHTTVRVASECQVVFRIVKPDAPLPADARSSVFHVPPFPSMDAIDPAVKLYEKRDELDSDLVETLLCIDWKINLLIKILSPIQAEAIYPYRGIITTMGTQNITLQTDQKLKIGTFVELHFVLPVLPFREMFLQGAVTAMDASLEEYEIALTMSNQSEADQEHLIRYIVKRQFQLKREQKYSKSAQKQ